MSDKDMSLDEAAAIAAQWGQTIRAFGRISEIVDAARSADQTRREAEAAAAIAKSAREADEAASVAAQQSAKDALAEKAEADKAAAAVVAEGKASAAELIQSARADAAKIIAAAQGEVAVIRTNIDAIEAERLAAEKAAGEAKRVIEADIASAQDDLDRIRAQIAAFKRSVGAVA